MVNKFILFNFPNRQISEKLNLKSSYFKYYRDFCDDINSSITFRNIFMLTWETIGLPIHEKLILLIETLKEKKIGFKK